MAIYHLEAKVISRGVGRSAVAASAYMSCSKIYNEYDGVQHDYTRKQGLVYEQVFLPPQAPTEWKDRGVLWNAVEEAEKTKDSRLAREFVVSLPVELDREQNIALISEYVKDNFVADGMCADVCIHDTDGHNPHAHIMLTVRPLDKNGKWQAKTQKEYLCIRDGEEKGFTAREFQAAQADGWEKQYQYFAGKKKVYLPSSQAKTQGYERVSKYPKSTRYGRQNPISERWNSEEQLQLWRKNWADIANKFLEQAKSESRIDHRSHKARGIDEQPTIYESAAAHIMEKRGFISDRCELNRQIKADNKLLREIKANIKRLMQAVADTIPKIADTLETMRIRIAAVTYNLLSSQNRRRRIYSKTKSINETFSKYTEVSEQLKAKIKERTRALEQKKSLPVYKVIRHKEMSRLITTLTEEREELQSEKNKLLTILHCEKDADIKQVKKSVSDMQLSIETLQIKEQTYSAELQTALKEFAEIRKQANAFDETELVEERLTIRPKKQEEYYTGLRETHGIEFDSGTASESLAQTDKMLGEDLYNQRRSILEKLRRLKYEQKRTKRNRTHRDRDDGDLEL